VNSTAHYWPALLVLTAISGTLSNCGASDQGGTAQRQPTPVCEPGRQVECACPSSPASGTQVCDEDGTRYLPCQCDPVSPTGGADPGPAGAGSPAVGAGGVQGVASGGASTEPAGSSGAHVGGEAGADTVSADDGCPEGPSVNCSLTCEQQIDCPLTECFVPIEASRVRYASPEVGGSITIRTPSNPGTVGCNACDSGTSAVAAITLQGYTADPVMYEVEAPWYLVVPSASEGHAICESRGRPCVKSPSQEPILVATSDPAAPSRNIRATTTFDLCP
jgi:hypothetical protein